MARKKTFPGSAAQQAVRPAAPKSPEKNSGSSFRLIALLCLLVILLVVGIASRGTDIWLWWLSRRSATVLRSAAASAPRDPLTLYAYADKLLQTGRNAEALQAFMDAEKVLPSGAQDFIAERIWGRLGYLLAQADRAVEAGPFLKKAQKLNDDDTYVHLGLGMIFAHQKRWDAAENQFKIVVHTDPSIAEGWFRLGVVYNSTQSFQQALDPLQHAVALRPEYTVPRFELGNTYANLHQMDKAIVEFRKVVQQEPKNATYRGMLGIAMGITAHSQTEYEEAVRVLEESVRSLPKITQPEVVLASLYVRFNHLEEARRHLRHAVTMDPDDSTSWYKLAQAEQRLGNMAAYRQADSRFHALFDFHNQQMILGTEVGSRPGDVDLHVKYARFALAHGNLIGALQEYDGALKYRPKDAAIKREMDAVENTYDKAMAKNPKGDYAHFHPPPFIGPLVDEGDHLSAPPAPNSISTDPNKTASSSNAPAH